MSGSTLVIQICEKCGYKKYGASIYIFYDYKRELYGLCFGTIDTMSDNDEKCVKKNFNYYCDNEHSVINFVKNYIPYDSMAEMSLINYDDLPKDSDKITYELLFSMDEMDNEVFSYEFNENNNIVDPELKLIEMMNIIHNVYNEY